MKATTAAAMVAGFAPLISKVELAFGAEIFTFAWISDTHLYPGKLNTRFVEKVVRAVDNVNAMDPAPDYWSATKMTPAGAHEPHGHPKRLGGRALVGPGPRTARVARH